MIGTLSLIGALSEQEKGALVVLATSYGGNYQQMLGQVTNDYLIGDPATVEQVQTYMRSGSVKSTISTISPIFLVLAGIGVAYWLGGKYEI